jgi:hypothetical protein
MKEGPGKCRTAHSVVDHDNVQGVGSNRQDGDVNSY